MSAGCKHNILPVDQRFVTALTTSDVVEEIIVFVSALAVQFRRFATEQFFSSRSFDLW